MADDKRNEEDLEYYNLEGGKRHVVVKGGKVKAVAPGLRLVDATEEEKEPFKEDKPKKPKDYGLPV